MVPWNTKLMSYLWPIKWDMYAFVCADVLSLQGENISIVKNGIEDTLDTSKEIDIDVNACLITRMQERILM